MNEEEIREIVRQTVRSTLRELFYEDYPRRSQSREREAFSEFESQISRLSHLISDIEKKWPGTPACLYEKGVVDSIKLDTDRIP